MGQDGILRPIGNRPSVNCTHFSRRPIRNWPQGSVLPRCGSMRSSATSRKYPAHLSSS